MTASVYAINKTYHTLRLHWACRAWSGQQVSAHGEADTLQDDAFCFCPVLVVFCCRARQSFVIRYYSNVARIMVQALETFGSLIL